MKLSFAKIVERYVIPYGLQFTAFISTLFLISPIIWMVSTSVKNEADVFNRPPEWIPSEITFDSYFRIMNGFVANILYNSILIALLAAIIATIVGALTAYALSRFAIPGKSTIMLFFLSSLAFPIPLLMMSMYILLMKLGLLDTLTSMVIGHTVITLPITVWLMKNFIDQIPKEIEEAAFVEGASFFRIIFFIVFPLSMPALTASALFVFVTSWNELFFGLSFISSPDLRTVPVGISQSFLQDFKTDWTGMMSLAVIVTIPIGIIFIFLQKSFLRGMIAGSVKG
ncbi:MAG: carbohydrate ABC transporter permease [Candidatus Puniceispirillales bacterium]|jgi:ABC-type glycerol-3-phosphate transport system permease component|tara:strand:+ start:1932 stop:2783 length:852 start_codon:yes stop_codon:yes gene_type:complete